MCVSYMFRIMLSIIVQMHVFKPSLSLRHESLVSNPPTMAAWHLLTQARNQMPVAKFGSQTRLVQSIYIKQTIPAPLTKGTPCPRVPCALLPKGTAMR